MSAHDISEAISMIRESAAGIAVRHDLGRIRKLRYSVPGFDRTTWRNMCEMGWLALSLPEEKGGVGLGMTASCALMEELGRALVPEPVIGATLAIQTLGDDQLPDVLSGEKMILPAWQTTRSGMSTSDPIPVENGTVNGVMRYVPMAAGADAFVVATANGWGLVDAHSPTLALDVAQTQDGGHYGTLTFSGTPVSIVSDTALAGPVAQATLATAAYLLGVIDEAIERTLDYLRTRVQFGKPIGSFQSLQHRMVDLSLEAALTRASVADAARIWDGSPGSSKAYAAVSRAKARASTTAMLVTRQAIQMHGGIGYTDEHDIGLYLRKAMVMAPAYGDAALHRKRFAQYMPDHAEAAA
ncbi:acyl-CoA dehydrogenase family protein [Sphingobium subterraneum]|uniref:Alkylation response protein AidB-like acyl-CoA dehydrogenase n=1 Tax=Sphingobium subterraneum TaxID=627688 RepID=A0A841J3Z3_9SPHN|nr:acyl-CoA dehydrogenase family protein [Sphingobium subterraneum]MBB6122971.1 alkylation response protein AidB-like acyl-CoA dehydrogenase [Sphingobium subterraneum]